MATRMTDPRAATHGLPPSLRVPVAAAGIEAIETYVGNVIQKIDARQGTDPRRVNAMLVQARPFRVPRDPLEVLGRVTMK